ncbi:histidine phosphatase family protein [Sebaldella sp. S0638]|uniref:histidine phosphatase family protein n=1 Tax=Sebaldella sp. S0638 TaxID=2957809 RepID=UPI0020A0A3FE|nr:histidine phosphatase family protein [Sebaldella sp. S0638]MCP1225063.1 histidine phosphatase family protein [Sebaldella sp. S0638]
MCKEEQLNIYFVRHGETLWNKEERIQGELDSPLTIKGIEDIQKLAGNLSGVEFDEVYSSELGRAYETASILSDGRHRIKRLKEFNEKNFGDWQGMEIKEIYRKYPMQAEFYFNDIKNYNNKEINAESLEHALRRFVLGVRKIVKSLRTGNVLVVSHGTILKLFFNYIDNKDVNELNEKDLMENTSFRVLKYCEGNLML